MCNMKKYSILVSTIYLLIVHISMVISFGASLFGNRFLFRNHHYITKPSQAYHLRKPYAQKHGPYGENFIETAGKVPLYQKPRRPKFILPTFAPFGTEGFTFSPEEEEIRRRRQRDRRERERRQRGHRP